MRISERRDSALPGPRPGPAQASQRRGMLAEIEPGPLYFSDWPPVHALSHLLSAHICSATCAACAAYGRWTGTAGVCGSECSGFCADISHTTAPRCWAGQARSAAQPRRPRRVPALRPSLSPLLHPFPAEERTALNLTTLGAGVWPVERVAEPGTDRGHG